MAQRVLSLIFLAWLGLGLPVLPACASLFPSQGSNSFVPVDQALSFDFRQQGHELRLNWDIRPGYYLYRQQIKLEPVNAQLAPVNLPAGLAHQDEFFGTVAIYKQSLALRLGLQQVDSGGQLRVTYQGCAEAGFCYPPETRVVPLSALSASGVNSPAPVATIEPGTDTPSRLPFSPLWALLIGIGIAFTPCVLPMYPLISSIILGNKAQLSSARVLLLAVVYVQGMAITYTLLGMAVAAAGLQFQAALQQPAILIGLSVVFILLALSMFGLYSLQLPSSLQTRLTLWSNRQQQGSLAGVLAMGILAGLFCSPCTTAPLSAILLYIAQSGNLFIGGLTLYLYALGMGIPLVLVALFGHRLLPRSGPWMQQVKEGFGFVILALPVFLLERVLGDSWGMRLWSLLAMAFLGWAFLLCLQARYRASRLVAIGVLALMMVASRPLQDWLYPLPQAQPAHTGSALQFTRVNSLEEIKQALNAAPGKPVMLDLYADWCVACKEFEKYTFRDSAVQPALAHFTLLQADVTANAPAQKRLLSQLHVLGLPTLLFFDARGQEIPDSRVTGYMNGKDFLNHLHKLDR